MLEAQTIVRCCCFCQSLSSSCSQSSGRSIPWFQEFHHWVIAWRCSHADCKCLVAKKQAEGILSQTRHDWATLCYIWLSKVKCGAGSSSPRGFHSFSSHPIWSASFVLCALTWTDHCVSFTFVSSDRSSCSRPLTTFSHNLLTPPKISL